jgi:hypothetical protein
MPRLQRGARNCKDGPICPQCRADVGADGEWSRIRRGRLPRSEPFDDPYSRGDRGVRSDWFALDESRPLGFFAGIWTRWTSVRKVREGETTNDLFAFLTTEPNAIVAPIHPKAMPVILTRPDEIEAWLAGPTLEALKLQRRRTRRRCDRECEGSGPLPPALRGRCRAALAPLDWERRGGRPAC